MFFLFSLSLSFLNLDLETLFELPAIHKSDDCGDSVLLLACRAVGRFPPPHPPSMQLYRVYVPIDDVKEAGLFARGIKATPYHLMSD